MMVLWLERKSVWPVKNRVMWCWCGYLSGLGLPICPIQRLLMGVCFFICRQLLGQQQQHLACENLLQLSPKFFSEVPGSTWINYRKESQDTG